MKPFKIAALCLFIICSCTAYGQQKPVKGKAWNMKLTGAELPMVWVAPGTFTMGSPSDEKGRKADEGPQTNVTLNKGYWIGATELTIGQWKAVTGLSLRDKVNKMLADETLYDFNGKSATISSFMNFDRNQPDKIIANENDGLPMYFVSWNEAMAFCKKLTEQEKAAGRLPAGYEYTLPTEAQWEFACRAGTTDALYNNEAGEEGLTKIAWYGSNSANGYVGKKEGNTKAGPRNSGEKKPNALGAYDMLGNLWEWCRDWYGPLPGGNVTDPTGPATGQFRVDKGGSWGSGPNDERAANRAQNPPNEDSAWRGFRIALCAVQ